MALTQTQCGPRNRFFHDIVALILDANDHWWPRDLCHLARVSQAWLNPVQTRLYSHPSLTSYEACCKLSQALRANPGLASLLRGLELRPIGPTSMQTLSALRFLLTLDGLQNLHLGGDLAIEAERFIGFLGSSESITTLSIDGTLLAHKFDSPASLEWDDFVSCRFPKLKVLNLSHLELDVSFTSSPPPFTLKELHLNNISLIGGTLTQFLPRSPIPTCSITLSDGCEYDSDQIHSVLAHCSVECFRLEARGMTSQWQGFFDAASPPCTSLQDLVLDEVFLDYDGLVSVSQHYPSLRKLRIVGRAGHLSPLQWTEFISSGSLPRLEYLILPWLAREGPSVAPWTSDGVNQLRDACVSRNIVLS